MDLKQAADTIVNKLMAVKPGETVLVIVDERSQRIGDVLVESSKEAGAEALLVKMAEREAHGTEPPRQVAELMKQVDVVMAPTSKSLSHTKARREASQAGARIATMPTITEDMMGRTMSADYSKIKERSEKIAAAMSGAREIHITTAAGTDLRLSLEGRTAIADHGLLTEKGIFGNLPAGEAYAAPLEGTTNGVLVIDGSMSGIGKLDKPLRVTIKDGYVEQIDGPQGQQLTALLDSVGRDGRNIAELGVGTNDRAMITGNVLEDEKVMGTIHVAFGNNATMGGKVNVPQHLDGIVNRPTVVVDGRTLMKDGEIAG